MKSFRVAVDDYFDSSTQQSSGGARPHRKTAEQSVATCTNLIRRSGSVSTKVHHQAVEGYCAKFVRPPSCDWALMAAVGDTGWTVFEGCLGQQPAQPGSRSPHMFTTPLPAARTTSSVTDLSDIPQDLSVRTSARHVTSSDSSTTPTIDTSRRFQHTVLPGKSHVYLQARGNVVFEVRGGRGAEREATGVCGTWNGGILLPSLPLSS